ncbi:hypothetical protein [Herpetosiphon llansteffanensis]|uniref:hypothetical protein n=1 Tax=Herpetosiphon llansteffanensis TaxID=2094568 RepID=UPI000D7BFF5E|nr:hypothetical protein [Herpetosiphon llansteffanensis]
MIQLKTKALQKQLRYCLNRIDPIQDDQETALWSDYEMIGRCYYYLRDERATEYIQQAAVLLVQRQGRTIEPRTSHALFSNAAYWFSAANLYRLVADANSMRACLIHVRAAESSPLWQDWPKPLEFYWDLLALAALMEGDALQALMYDAKIAALPEREHPDRPWSGRLAEAIVHADAPAIRAIGSELHGWLIRYHGKPWSTSYLNLWDWYELTDQLADRLEAQQACF